jgi:hypothetical protein
LPDLWPSSGWRENALASSGLSSDPAAFCGRGGGAGAYFQAILMISDFRKETTHAGDIEQNWAV